MRYLIKLTLCADADCYTSINKEEAFIMEDAICEKIKGTKREVLSKLNKVVKEATSIKYTVCYGKVHIPEIMENLTTRFISQVKGLIHNINNDKVKEGRTFHEEGGNQYFTIEVIAL